MRIPFAGWVAPFGDPGINDRSHLPRAFRSVPRPSSPLSAKASTRCPSFALDHKGRSPRGITRTASRPPENRRAQGQAPPSLDRGATPPAAARMKTLLRTATGIPAHAPQDNSPTEQQASAAARPPRSHSQIRFTLQSTPAPEPRPPARDMPARPLWNRNQTWSSPSIGPEINSSAHTGQTRSAICGC
jgi:hypothetical protein